MKDATLNRKLLVHGTVLVSSTVCGFLFFWLLVHALTLFPNNLAIATHNQAAARRSFELNCAGGALPHRSIPCDVLAGEAGGSVYTMAADLTMTRLADEANVFRLLGCSQWGWCSRAIEMLFSYTYMLILPICVLLFFYAYNAMVTYSTYQRMQWMMQGRQTFDSTGCIVSVLGEQKKTS